MTSFFYKDGAHIDFAAAVLSITVVASYSDGCVDILKDNSISLWAQGLCELALALCLNLQLTPVSRKRCPTLSEGYK